MPGPLFAKTASDALLAWLEVVMPLEIAILNTENPVAYGGTSGSASIAIALEGIVSYSDHAWWFPPRPAVYVLPQSSGLRQPGWPVELDETHEFYVCIETGDQDPGVAHAKLLYYVAGLVRAAAKAVKGTHPIGGGCHLDLGHEGNSQVVAWGVSQDPKSPTRVFEFAMVAFTVWCEEIPA